MQLILSDFKQVNETTYHWDDVVNMVDVMLVILKLLAKQNNP